MARRVFHQELERLVGEIVSLGREVEVCLGGMVEAMEGWDAEIARRMVGSDASFKERGAQIADECMVIQARQAPVARDLRLVYTAQAITNHLVRTGTLCEHICCAIVETADVQRDPDLQSTIFEMSLGARDLFREGLDVFEKRDVERAQGLRADDDKVDLLYMEAMNLVVNPSTTNEGGGGEGGCGGSPEWRIRVALVVHYLERIADHGVAIGGRTIFLVTGERVEDAMTQYRERRLKEPGE
ncbi:MAG TPA: phosphate uptake regulator PhoU [Rubrobacteraceae bacterium]|nr:phosphate uptake regulator PhoU [Rubrobacteraceae bacterium]